MGCRSESGPKPGGYSRRMMACGMGCRGAALMCIWWRCVVVLGFVRQHKPAPLPRHFTMQASQLPIRQTRGQHVSMP